VSDPSRIILTLAPDPDHVGRDRLLHQTFELSILLKGAFAALEALGGLLLWLIGPTTILSFVTWLTQAEVSEHPSDLVARSLLHWAHGFSIEVEHFYAIYLLTHGLVEIVLVAGLLRGARWAYPTSLAVMAAFVVYQLYRFSFTHGPGLLVLTVFDLLVIALIWREWRHQHFHTSTR
jgi:uncharacterized membrane protein